MNGKALEGIRKELERAFPELRFVCRQELGLAGDIEMDGPVIEVFGVPPESKREFFARSRGIREEAARKLGERLFFVTHTPEATERYYGEAIRRAVGDRKLRIARLKSGSKPRRAKVGRRAGRQAPKHPTTQAR
jgi:hypothetical protein